MITKLKLTEAVDDIIDTARGIKASGGLDVASTVSYAHGALADWVANNPEASVSNNMVEFLRGTIAMRLQKDTRGG